MPRHPRLRRYPVLLAILLAGPSWPAEGPLREFHEPLDRFALRRIEPSKVLLSCRFEKSRTNVRPLVLAVEEDNEIAIRFFGGRVLSGTEVLTIQPPDALESAEWTQVERMWLSDIPLAAIRFPKVDSTRFRSRVPESATAPISATGTPRILEGIGTLVEATFELAFSRPLPPPDPKLDSPAAERDLFARIAAELVANPTDIQAIRGVTEASRNTGTSVPHSGGGKLLRLETSAEGVYRVDTREIEACGFELSSATLSRLTLFHRGQPVPLGFHPPESESTPAALWFWAEAQRNGESDTNVYYLGWGQEDGPRISTKATLAELFQDLPGPERARDWDLREVRIEKDDPSAYANVPGVTGAVEVYWREFKVSGEAFDADFDLEGFDPSASATPGGETSTLLVRIVPSETARGEGSLTLTLNGRELGALTLPENARVLELESPSSTLRARGNHIHLRFEGKYRASKARHWGVFLDWLAVRYPARASLAAGGAFSLSSWSEDVRSASSSWVRWSEADPNGDWWLLAREESAAGAIQGVTLNTEDKALIGPSRAVRAQWRIADLKRAPRPSLRLVENRPVLRRNDLQADLLVVAAPRFVETLEAFLDRRRSEGWTCLVATPDQIYEEFSHGIKDLHAIKEFCGHAYFHYRKPHPQALWLVGEARLDPRNLLGSRVEDLVPSPVEREREAAYSQDQWYSELVGSDSLPDLLVSRVSVDDVTELSNYLAKVREDEDSPQFGWWRARGLFLADDGFGARTLEFLREGLDRVLDPKLIRVEDFARSPNRKFEAIGKVGQETRGLREEVVRRWSDGARLVEYSGHGGIIVWSHEALFKGLNRPDSDVDRLHNTGRYSHVTIKSCLSASVNWPTFPGEVSVAEALIKAPRRGAISVLGSAGTEYARDQDRFGTKFFAGLWNHQLGLVSAARVYAHVQFELQSPEKAKVARQFVLHGDPLVRFDVPRPLRITQFAWEEGVKGPLASLSWSSTVEGGTAEIRFRSRGADLFSRIVPNPLAGESVGPFETPPDLPFRPDLQVAVYVWNPSRGMDAYGSGAAPSFPVGERDWKQVVAGWVQAASGGDLELGDFRLSPASPSVGDEIVLEVQARNRSSQVRSLSSLEARFGPDPKRPEVIGAHGGQAPATLDPLFPGESRTYRWIIPAPKARGIHHLHLRAGLESGWFEKTAQMEVVKEPEITLLSLQPSKEETAYPLAIPMEFRVGVQNIGDSSSEPLILTLQDALAGAGAQVNVPSMECGQVGEVTFETDSPQHRFVWETQMELPPSATTSRTRWRQHSFVLDVTRSEKITTLPWLRELDRREGFVPFRVRNFDNGDRTLRVPQSARFREFPVMELDFPDTSEIRSATHAGAAAWQYHRGWWVSPQQLQAHPAWEGVPLRAKLPWHGAETLALIAPTYYKDNNYQGVGFPMPALRLEGDQVTFDLAPANTSEDGAFPYTLVELGRDGLEWTIRKSPGAWPGFSGLRIALLPEVTSPIYVLAGPGPYHVNMRAEWVPQAPDEFRFEARAGRGGLEGAAWVPMGPEGLSVEGDHLQFRGWITPDESARNLAIRSLRLEVTKPRE
ncbi:MAG: hypothetical protein HUU16_13105 [Candidatus Omnitrophica bacterium]|nr:hypothetical protein [Candidatus Omnitrophota bacterium]